MKKRFTKKVIVVTALLFAAVWVSAQQAPDARAEAAASKDTPVNIGKAFWNFEAEGDEAFSSFTVAEPEILEYHVPTHIGQGFTTVEDEERGRVLEMPGGSVSAHPDSTIIFGNSIPYTGNAPRTLMFWVKQGKADEEPESDSWINNGVITSWGINENGERFTLRFSNQGMIRIEIQGNFIQTVADDLVELHTWHHIIVQVPDMEDASTGDMKIWVDGELYDDVTTGNQDVLINTAESGFAFGHNQIIHPTLFGYIDEFLMLDEAPSEDKIFGREATTIGQDLGIDLVYPGLDTEEWVYVEEIILSADADEVEVGEDLQINAEVLPPDADDPSVTWSVDAGTGFAIIDQTGLLTGIEAGTVIAKATADDGSEVYGTLDITVVEDDTSVNEISLEDASVFPNPSTGVFEIQLPCNVPHADYQVYNALGSVVKTGQFNGSSHILDLSGMNGLFLLRMQTAKQNHVVRLIIQ